MVAGSTAPEFPDTAPSCQHCPRSGARRSLRSCARLLGASSLCRAASKTAGGCLKSVHSVHAPTSRSVLAGHAKDLSDPSTQRPDFHIDTLNNSMQTPYKRSTSAGRCCASSQSQLLCATELPHRSLPCAASDPVAWLEPGNASFQPPPSSAIVLVEPCCLSPRASEDAASPRDSEFGLATWQLDMATMLDDQHSEKSVVLHVNASQKLVALQAELDLWKDRAVNMMCAAKMNTKVARASLVFLWRAFSTWRSEAKASVAKCLVRT